MLEQVRRVVCSWDNRERRTVRVTTKETVKSMESRQTILVWKVRSKPHGISEMQYWPQMFRSQATQYRDLRKVGMSPGSCVSKRDCQIKHYLVCALNRKTSATSTEVPFLGFLTNLISVLFLELQQPLSSEVDGWSSRHQSKNGRVFI